MLAVLAHKMNLTEEYDADFVYDINPRQLFQQVKHLNIPFHKWYIWIGEKFATLSKVQDEEEKK